MRCPFCAEEIRDEAILCRFCGARKEAGEWKPPAPPAPGAGAPASPPGAITLRLAGAFLIGSAIFEVAWPFAEVPLFGAVRSGAAALAYHVAFAGLYAVMGVGLASLRPWGAKAVYAGTAVYTIDRLLWLLDSRAQDAYFAQQAAGFEGFVDKGTVSEITTLTTLAILASWWGFAAYVYWRRGSFEAQAPPR